MVIDRPEIVDRFQMKTVIDFVKLRNFITVKEAKAFYGKFTTVDVAKMVTSVYEEPENLELPIAWVTMACFAVQRGDTTRDAAFMALRKHLSNELRRKDAHPFNEVDPIDIILNSRPK